MGDVKEGPNDASYLLQMLTPVQLRYLVRLPVGLHEIHPGQHCVFCQSMLIKCYCSRPTVWRRAKRWNKGPTADPRKQDLLRLPSRAIELLSRS